MSSPEIIEKWEEVIEVLSDLVKLVMILTIDQSSQDLHNQLRISGCKSKSQDYLVLLYHKYCSGIGF